MKIKLTILFLGLLTLGLRTPNRKVIVGTLTANLKEQNYFDGLQLLIELKHDSTIVSRTTIERDGSFTFTSDITQDLDLFYRGLGVTETYLATVKQNSPDTLNLKFIVPRHYKKISGKVKCPKCNKSDNTIPVHYGLESVTVVRQISKSGDTTYVPFNEKNYFDGGCFTSEIDPQWYCKRDKIKF